jgi:predicted dehydrogenase
MTRKRMGRREFVGRTAAAGVAVWAASPTARVLGANNTIRFGLIGAGARGQELLSQALKLPDVELVAVADVYTRRLDEVRRVVPGVRALSDHRSLLDHKDVDAVIVASPLHCHAHHFLDAIAAGKDLYCEKTMTWSIAEAEACRRAAGQSDRVIGIGLQHVSGGAFADAKQWLKDGLLGKVTSVESWMSRNTPRGHGQWVRAVPADCTAENVDWTAFLNGRPARPFDGYAFINWRLFWEFSGGNVTENMIHQMSWIMGLLDLPLPTAASMAGGVFSEKDGREVPDTIAVTLEFPGDLVVSWQSTFSNSHYGLGERVLGSHGTVERLSGATDMVTGRLTSGIRYYPEPVNRPPPLGVGLDGHAPEQDHMANFFDCVRARRQPNAPVELGYRTAVVAHMANSAYRKHRRVTAEEALASAAQ